MKSIVRLPFPALLMVSLLLFPPRSSLHAQESSSATVTPAAEGVYTDVQADRGRDLYEMECTLCHGAREFSGTAFLRRWGTVPLNALFGQIRDTMPQTAPGMLSAEQTADLIAYVLSLNGYPAGDTDLPTAPDALAQIQFGPPADSNR